MARKAVAKKPGAKRSKPTPAEEAKALKRFKAFMKRNAGKHRFEGLGE